ncbi:MAG: phosphonate metabolism transcriptional regulator PhnF [Pseudomonadota bacterium]|jgi:GntR family phosphonate transport system transcriptional regulator
MTPKRKPASAGTRETSEHPQARLSAGQASGPARNLLLSALGGSVWSRIEQYIAGEIARGAHLPGERLPAEHVLAQTFGVNRHTVRQALASLAAKGLVRVTQGSGTYVEDFAVDLALGKRTRHSQNLASAGLTGTLRLLHASTYKASAICAKWLHVPAGTALLRLITVGDARGRPITYSERFFPQARFADMADVLRATGSVTKALAAHGVTDYTRRESHITAQMPAAEVAQHLAQPASRAVLYVESVNVDPAGQPVEYARTYFSGDRVKLVVRADE